MKLAWITGEREPYSNSITTIIMKKILSFFNLTLWLYNTGIILGILHNISTGIFSSIYDFNLIFYDNIYLKNTSIYILYNTAT